MGYGSDRIWRERYTLRTFELDAAFRLSPQAVCNFLIDTAAHNADALGFSVPQLMEQQRTWFLSRLLMRLHEYPGWREELEVQTWPAGFQRLFALRQWRVLHRGRQIGEAASAWLMIDNRARRPIRPETLATWGEYIREEQALAHQFQTLPQLDGTTGGAGGSEKDFGVRFGDVDINGHAGYLSYVDWVLETAPAAVRGPGRLAELEIHYLAEVSHGERVLARGRALAAQPGAAEYLHGLVREADGREVCRARTIWALPPGARAA